MEYLLFGNPIETDQSAVTVRSWVAQEMLLLWLPGVIGI